MFCELSVVHRVSGTDTHVTTTALQVAGCDLHEKLRLRVHRPIPYIGVLARRGFISLQRILSPQGGSGAQSFRLGATESGRALGHLPFPESGGF